MQKLLKPSSFTIDTSLILDLANTPRDKDGHTYLDLLKFLIQLPTAQSGIIPVTAYVELTNQVPLDYKHSKFRKIRENSKRTIPKDRLEFLEQAGLLHTPMQGDPIIQQGNNSKLWIWGSDGQQQFFEDLLSKLDTDPENIKLLNNRGEEECLECAKTLKNDCPSIILLNDKKYIKDTLILSPNLLTANMHGIGYADLSSLVRALTDACGKNLNLYLNDLYGGNSPVLTYEGIANDINNHDIMYKPRVSPDNRLFNSCGKNVLGDQELSLDQLVKIGVEEFRKTRGADRSVP